jgi:pyruvate/2-oxoglutarate dehydrogenase complex dihydrolipoamide acyltransferase (E2) component
MMPALSSTMTSGKIVQWTVKPGDNIKAGQTVMVVESDKVRNRCGSVVCCSIDPTQLSSQ